MFLVYLRQQPRFKVCIFSENRFRLIIERYSDGAWFVVLCLFSNVFHSTINDVGTCHLFKVSHTAADETMKHEYVTIYLCGWRFVTEVGIVDFVTLFKCQIEWRAVQLISENIKSSLEIILCQSNKVVSKVKVLPLQSLYLHLKPR